MLLSGKANKEACGTDNQEEKVGFHFSLEKINVSESSKVFLSIVANHLAQTLEKIQALS